MRTAQIRQIVVFGLLLLCLGCVPVLAEPGAPDKAGTSAGHVPSATLTTAIPDKPGGPGNAGAAPTVKLVTPIWGTPRIVQETLDFPEKPTQAFATEFAMCSGEIMALKGGLTDEARNVLQSGQTGYFLLSFANPVDPTILPSLKDAGIKPLQIGSLYAEVPPSALETLETWLRDDKLVFGGPLPPAGKIEARLSEAIRASPNEAIQVSVILFTKPDEATSN